TSKPSRCKPTASEIRVQAWPLLPGLPPSTPATTATLVGSLTRQASPTARSRRDPSQMHSPLSRARPGRGVGIGHRPPRYLLRPPPPCCKSAALRQPDRG